jgi:hypothetical protein
MAQNDTTKDIMGTFSHMKRHGILKILIIALAAGALLFTVGGFLTDKEDGEQTNQDIQADEKLGFFEYKGMLEEEIEGLCMSVSGVQSASAVAFFDDVGGSSYAQNVQMGTSQSYKSEYVIIGSGSNSHALYLGEELPRLSGIGIVCRASGDIDKCNEITALLAAAYGLPMTRIYVSCQ